MLRLQKLPYSSTLPEISTHAETPKFSFLSTASNSVMVLPNSSEAALRLIAELERLRYAASTLSGADGSFDMLFSHNRQLKVVGLPGGGMETAAVHAPPQSKRI